jgi:hypothetical protein
MEKSLEELRAAIENEPQPDDNEDAIPPSEDDPKTQEDSDDETPSQEASSNPDEKPSEDEEKWVVPGKYKTNEDLLKGYSELESLVGRQGSEIGRLRKATDTPPRLETPEEKTARIAAFAESVERDPVAAIRNIAREETRELELGVKAKAFEAEYIRRKQDPEFNNLEPLMAEIATHYGDLIQANGIAHDPRLLDILQYAAKGIKATQIAQEAHKEGIKKGESLNRKKAKAKIEGPSGTKKTRKLDTTKLSAAEMKAKMESGEIDY